MMIHESDSDCVEERGERQVEETNGTSSSAVHSEGKFERAYKFLPICLFTLVLTSLCLLTLQRVLHA